MIKLTTFLLLSGLALISVTQCQSTCGLEEECLEASDCQFYTVEREKLNSLERNTADWTRQLNKLKSLVCNARERKVCCEKTTRNTTSNTTINSPGDAPNYRPSLAKEECGELNSHAGFILGGNDTRLGEYPFLALLGKTRRRGKSIFWHCGGTLINKWYVISAAHCGPRVEFVRLGEWEVVDPDSYNTKTCTYYNDNSLKKCDGFPGCQNCKLGDATVDCEDINDTNKCSASHQVSETV